MRSFLKQTTAIIAAAAIGAGAVAYVQKASGQGMDFSAFLILFENRLPLILGSEYPPNATPITGASADVAAASAVATLAGVAAKTTYIKGFDCTGMGATGAGQALITVAGTVTGSLLYSVAVPAGATVGLTPVAMRFTPPIPASALNTSITVTMGSLGTGNLHAACAAYGYQN